MSDLVGNQNVGFLASRLNYQFHILNVRTGPNLKAIIRTRDKNNKTAMEWSVINHGGLTIWIRIIHRGHFKETHDEARKLI